MIRLLFILLGGLFLGLGVIGILLPILPTTPFVLVAALCFAKGSKRCHQWLLKHRVFGKILRDWQHNRAVPLAGKILSLSMMTLSCTMLFYRLPASMYGERYLCAYDYLDVAITHVLNTHSIKRYNIERF